MKRIHPTKYTDKQWKRKYREYVRFCRKSPWKIDEEHIAEFDEFKRNTLDPNINTEVMKTVKWPTLKGRLSQPLTTEKEAVEQLARIGGVELSERAKKILNESVV